MQTVPAPGAWFRPPVRAIVAGGVIAILFAMPHRAGASGHAANGPVAAPPAPVSASPAPPARSALLGEFNAVCFDLTLARAALARGEMGDDEFADRILSLFVRADSLATLLRAASTFGRGGTADFALERGVTYLIDSLRENYVGIVARNGVSFLDADQALKAAVAWRSDAATGSPAR